jgi:protein-L-isoaspartate(D-aspartate) O-methyltransferase
MEREFLFVLIIAVVLVFVIIRISSNRVLEGKNESKEENEFSFERKAMVKNQLKSRGIEDKRVLEVMGRIPRHLFVGEEYRDKAYGDHPLPIGYGQTISQPYIVALMTESLELSGNEKVLEIGTGSGYQAAVLSKIVQKVYTIEIVKELAEQAKERLRNLGYENIEVKNADGYFGWEEHSPYDAIMITCAADHIPKPLLDQLKDGGKLIVPLGSIRYYQTLTLITKKGDDLEIKHITGVRFVPMTGEIRKGS